MSMPSSRELVATMRAQRARPSARSSISRRWSVREAAVVRAHELLARQLVEAAGTSRSQSPRLFTKSNVERCARTCSSSSGSIARPHAEGRVRQLAGGELAEQRARAAGVAAPRRRRQRHGARHVRDRHADLEVEGRARARVDDGDRAVAAEEARDLRQRPRGRREPDALRIALREGRDALERERQVRAALGRRQRVDLVDDQRLDAAQRLALLGAEDQVERLRRRDEDLRGVARTARCAPAPACRRCAPPPAAPARRGRGARRGAGCPTSGARRLRSMS